MFLQYRLFRCTMSTHSILNLVRNIDQGFSMKGFGFMPRSAMALLMGKYWEMPWRAAHAFIGAGGGYRAPAVRPLTTQMAWSDTVYTRALIMPIEVPEYWTSMLSMMSPVSTVGYGVVLLKYSLASCCSCSAYLMTQLTFL
jgi:hypothetical protein